ncbi:MAG TPA: hypothetical protein VD833_22860 [Vicinamibacterales bacterium]|nr:hypothetical protein [Vicinamibacterales bacterium]
MVRFQLRSISCALGRGSRASALALPVSWGMCVPVVASAQQFRGTPLGPSSMRLALCCLERVDRDRHEHQPRYGEPQTSEFTLDDLPDNAAFGRQVAYVPPGNP